MARGGAYEKRSVSFIGTEWPPFSQFLMAFLNHDTILKLPMAN